MEPTKEINVASEEEPKILKIGTKMDKEEKTVNILREYNDIFAWSMEEMPGIDPSVACHNSNIKKNVKSFKQRIRKIAIDYHP